MQPAENRRTKMTKQLLKSSLVELLHKKTINKITIKELCANADVNRSTFYLYYADQYALLDEVESELIAHAREHLDKMGSDYGTLAEVERLLEYIQANTDIFQIFFCKSDNLSFQSSFIEISFQNLKSNLSLNCSETVAVYVYDFLIMGSLSMVKKWIQLDFDMSSKVLANLIFKLADEAISVFSQ